MQQSPQATNYMFVFCSYMYIYITLYATFCLTPVKKPFAIPEDWPLKKGLTVQMFVQQQVNHMEISIYFKG